MNPRGGFTVAELLVFSGVLAIVAVLLLPALKDAHETANRAACASNLRQIGLGMLAYSDDYSGNFPTCYSASLPGGSNCNACDGLSPARGSMQFYQLLVKLGYVGSPNVFVCPSDTNCRYAARDWKVTPAAVGATMLPWNKSYFYVSRLSSRKGSKPYLLMADDSHYMADNCGRGCGPQDKVAPDLESTDNHGAEGRNALFSDDHVQWINSASIDPWFQTLQQDYDFFGLHFETID
jgi:hypothetical protein